MVFADSHTETVRPVLFETHLPDGRHQGWTDNYIRVAVESDSIHPGDIRPVQLGKIDGTHVQGWIAD